MLASPALAQTDFIVPAPNLHAEGIPPIPATLARKIGLYTEFRPKAFVGWHPVNREMLIATRAGNATQMHRLAAPMGKLEQLTDFPDPVRVASFEPRAGAYLVFGKDIGGSEQTQVFRMDFEKRASTQLTDPDLRHFAGEWNHARDRLVIGSTQLDKTGKRESVTTEVSLLDPLYPAAAKKVGSLPGLWGGFRFSPDDRQLITVNFKSNVSTEVWAIDLASGERKRLMPATPAHTDVEYEDVAYTPDGKALILASNEAGEFRQLVHYDFESGKTVAMSPDISWDVTSVAIARKTGVVAIIVNEAGCGVLRLFDSATLRELPKPSLPEGLVSGIHWHENGVDLGFNLQGARNPGDAYSLDVKTGAVTRWTETKVEGLDTSKLREPESISWKSFDGLTITGFLFRPPSSFTGRRPVIVNAHGGPESQARPGFQGRSNYFINDLGIAMIYPNIRGSSGFGKTFMSLDDGAKREDSIRDIGALFDWIATQPDLDPSRVLIMGGSYGGYVTLAVATMYPERIAGAIDIVGISNFVSFLEHTETYRRDIRRAEYGDERDPKMRAVLERISPLTNAQRISKPLFVVQGRNDPRVPWRESEQIVNKAKLNNVPVWYLLADDEGHGFAKKSNADFQFYAMILFAGEVLLK